MKYLRHRDFGFVLFEKRHHHDSMARRLGFDVKRITGAGFVMAVDEDAVTCGGESIMLRARASESDEKALQGEMG